MIQKEYYDMVKAVSLLKMGPSVVGLPKAWTDDGETLIQEYEVTAGNILVDLTSTGMAFMPDTTEYQSDFSSDLDGVTLSNAAGGATATWTFDTDHGVLAVTSAGASTGNPRLYAPITANEADRFYFTVAISYTVNSGTCILGGIIYAGGGSVSNIQETLTGTDTTSIEIFGDPDGTVQSCRLYFDGTNTFNISIHSITVTKHPAKTYLEPYQGNDTDSTPYRMVLVDSADKEASFFVGAAGGGKTLSAELITGWTNYISRFEGFTVNANGHDLDVLSNTVDGGACVGYTNDASIANNIVEITADFTQTSGSAPSTMDLYLSLKSSTLSEGTKLFNPIVAGEQAHTRTASSIENGLRVYAHGAYLFESSMLVSLKKYTDAPATGVHAITEQNGSTRGMTSIDADFDPNDIVEVQVWEL